MFKLESEYNPTGDQPQAIDQLVEGLKENTKFQTLKGVTGSGKTFTVANVIATFAECVGAFSGTLHLGLCPLC